ncbi:MAG: DUF3631 domain-containing protein [Verrucomicrobia bacterium]|nr:DUF3631 domain-containing protein [Verrucomicrobiota bacterium]
MFGVADVAGGVWPGRAAAAFSKLTSADDLDAQGIAALLLPDIQAVFGTLGADRLPCAKLAAALGEMEGRPWAECGKHRKPISPKQLANQLPKFGVMPRNIRLGDDTRKGYALDDFKEAFEHFLASPPTDRHTATRPVNIGDSALSKPRQEKPCGALENAVAINNDGSCGGVAGPNGESPENILLL